MGEQEREAYIQNAVKRVQEEALMLSNRAREEEMKRLEYIKLEEERIKREDALRAEAMARAEEERKQKEIARQEELRRQQELMRKQREELEQQRLLKRRQEDEERKMAKVEKVEMTKKSEESNHLAELKRQEELKMLERQRLEQMIMQESKLVKGQVAKRSDDVHGLGWGNVTTGFVSRKKLGFLQREISMERDSHEGSPASGFGSRTRGLRVTFAESPGGSRPESGAGWTERVAEMDSQTMRAQTPPLAGEWAVSKGAQSISHGSSSLVQTQGSREMKSSSFQSSGSSNMQSSQMSSSMSSSKQVSSFQSSQTSSFSSAQKSSFSSSQSSSFQSSSIQASKAFEAFPGMGGIENLKLEESEN